MLIKMEDDSVSKKSLTSQNLNAHEAHEKTMSIVEKLVSKISESYAIPLSI